MLPSSHCSPCSRTPLPHTASCGSVASQVAALGGSHCSPRAGSMKPSPHVDCLQVPAEADVPRAARRAVGERRARRALLPGVAVHGRPGRTPRPRCTGCRRCTSRGLEHENVQFSSQPVPAPLRAAEVAVFAHLDDAVAAHRARRDARAALADQTVAAGGAVLGGVGGGEADVRGGARRACARRGAAAQSIAGSDARRLAVGRRSRRRSVWLPSSHVSGAVDDGVAARSRRCTRRPCRCFPRPGKRCRPERGAGHARVRSSSHVPAPTHGLADGQFRAGSAVVQLHLQSLSQPSPATHVAVVALLRRGRRRRRRTRRRCRCRRGRSCRARTRRTPSSGGRPSRTCARRCTISVPLHGS